MGYYIAKISVSFFAGSEEEIISKSKRVLNAARDSKECSPHVNEVIQVTNDPDNREVKVNASIIKKINQKI